MEHKTLQVNEFLTLVNETLRMIPSQDFLVEGEVSDFRVAQGKWVSFDLKDEEEQAVLKCFMTVWQLKVELEDGMRVQVKGYPKVYERFGSFKMNIQDVELVGEGALRRAYELLKKKLETEGLFDLARKRSLPRFPERIGLVTSRDAAAYGDFVRILNNRWGGLKVDHMHVHVQGREAVREILGAFEHFNASTNKPDVIVLTRGGGGLEDLHAFNDEQVARAVFQSKIPVVCAVGHERDESLCDFVADVRASTPSNAAERIVPSREEVLYEIETMSHRMMDQLHDRVGEYDAMIERVFQLTHWFEALQEKVISYEKILRQVDPRRVLSRGYAIVRSGVDVLKDAMSLETGTQVGVQLAAGSFDAEVLKTYASKKEDK